MTVARDDLACHEADELAGLYVLGALEPAEEAAVRTHFATCAQPHPELAELGSVVPAFADLIEPVEPPAELRERVLAAVSTTLQAREVAALDAAAPMAEGLMVVPDASARTETVAPDVLTAQAPERAEPRTLGGSAPISLAAERARRSRSLSGAWRTVMAAAAVLLIVVLAGTAVAFQRQAADAQARAGTLAAAVTASLDPTSSTASLKGSGVAASASGFAAFPQAGTGFLVIRGLPQVPAGKTYEAWFLAGSTPFPSVLISPQEDGLVIVSGLTAAQGADAMALTIEPAGGVQAPTGDVVVLGTMRQGPVALAIAFSGVAARH